MAVSAQIGPAERAHQVVQRAQVAPSPAPGSLNATILDYEPTGNLGLQTSEKITGKFQKLKSQGIYIIIVTHESDIAAFTAGRSSPVTASSCPTP
jgi:putative ABC transport system ATP-binding protein